MLQLKGKRSNNWDKKLQTLKDFVYGPMEAIINKIENLHDYSDIKQSIKMNLEKGLNCVEDETDFEEVHSFSSSMKTLGVNNSMMDIKSKKEGSKQSCSSIAVEESVQSSI